MTEVIEGFEDRGESKPLGGIPAGRVIAVYYADWCGPCKWFKDDLRRNNTDLTRLLDKKGIKIRLLINADYHSEFCAGRGINAIPQWKIYNDGRVIAEGTGAVEYSHFRKRLDKIDFEERNTLGGIPAPAQAILQ